jgi:hypothetical protein
MCWAMASHINLNLKGPFASQTFYIIVNKQVKCLWADTWRHDRYGCQLMELNEFMTLDIKIELTRFQIVSM